MENIESIYELSPVQNGMLFHTLYSPESGVYFEHLTCTIEGDLNLNAFQKAWQTVIQRHSALRTCFHWEELDKPLQVVHSEVPFIWDELDWRGKPEAQLQADFADYLRTDRQEGFELDEAPLMRFAVIQESDDRYQFIWSFHHLLLDGWSLGVIFQEFFAAYQAESQGTPLQLSKPRNYVDFINWLQQKDLSQAEAFWRENLKRFRTATPLPFDKPTGEAASESDYSEQKIKIDATTTKALEALARDQQLTLNTLLQGAWALILSQTSSEEQVVFGSTVSGRPPELPGVESMVGMFINTLPARVATSGDSELIPWLKQLQADHMQREEYSYSPPADIQAWSDVPKGQHLFESIVVFENYPLDEKFTEGIGGLKVSNARTYEKTNYPLTLVAVPGEELSLQLTFATNRFESKSASRILQILETVLKGIAADPNRTIAALPLVSDAELQKIVFDWNQTAADYPRDKTVHQLFEAQAAKSPNAIAVELGEQQLTFDELNRRANQVAHYLRSLGVGPDTLVGICSHRTPELMIAMLGVIKAGGAYLPLDPAYPQERLEFMLEDAKVNVLLTQEKLAGNFEAKVENLFRLDSDWEKIVDQSDVNPELNVSPDNLAYIIYTSGSTGKPKGAMIVHRGVVNYLSWCTQAYQVDQGIGAPVQSSIGFDATVTSIWSPLVVGKKVVLLREEDEVEELAAVLGSDEPFSLFKLTPAHLDVLSQLVPADQAHGTRAMVIGGEALTAEHIAFWRKNTPDTRLINEYGPTETVVGCCVYDVPKDAEVSGSISIGRPIANTQLYVLDSNQRPVPVGIAGELYIGGDGVAQGYLNRPELTAERFLRNPFSDDPNARMYKTGDLVRYREDGNLEFLGRIDHQVKIRGYRIELGEIEAVLSDHSSVSEVAVIAAPGQSGQRLIAYVVTHEGQELDTESLKAFLLAKLPDHMVPSAWVEMETLPLTNNGKVDRKALPEPERNEKEFEANYVAPENDAEEILVEIWADVLQIEQVGVHDNFFELGGDSILSIQIVSRAKQEGLQITPKHLFEHQTVSQLAKAIEADGPAIHAEQGTVTGSLPLTPIQQWFFDQDLPNPHHWNQAVLLEVPNDFRFDYLQQSVRALIEHHDALRLRYTQNEAGWSQENADFDEELESNLPVSHIDLSSTKSEDQAAAIEDACTKLQQEGNLTDGPLMRVAQFKLGGDQADRLFVTVQHLAVDGVSWRILLQDLFAAYQQLASGEEIEFADKTTSYKEWAHRLTEYAESETLQEEVDYWLAQSPVETAKLPVDHEVDAKLNTEASEAKVAVSLTQEETQALLQEVPAAYNTQINDVLLTAVGQAFRDWTNQSNLVVELEGHGRETLFDDVDLSRTVGWFTSIFPVQLDLQAADRPADAIRSVKEQLRAVPNRGIGYGSLRYSSDPQIAAQFQQAAHPQVCFNYMGSFDQLLPESEPIQMAKESYGPARNPEGRRTHLLEVTGSVIGGKLEMEFLYSENFHDSATIEKLGENFIQALRSLINHCLSPEAGGYTPSDFPEAELDQDDLDDVLAALTD